MVRHESFFEALAEMEPADEAWRSVLAGLVVLRLLDVLNLPDRSVLSSDWAGFYSARKAVDTVREGDPVRRVLTAILDQLQSEKILPASLATNLLSYGRALDYEARWQLAADVFAFAAELAPPDVSPKLAIEANSALAAAARHNGDWELSADRYARAAHIADTVGDLAGSLRVQVGMANTHAERGNHPAAEQILQRVVTEASVSHLDDVAALALHTRAMLAHRQSNYGDAVRLAYDALKLTTNPTRRDAVLADIAASFAELGMRDAARDAQLIIAATSQQQWVRWQATLNLMELASIEGMEAAFESYAEELAGASLDPRLRAYFLLYLGQGQERFGKEELAEASISEAIQFATSHKLHQIAFEAETSLKDLRTGRSKRARIAALVAPLPELQDVAEAIGKLRQRSTT